MDCCSFLLSYLWVTYTFSYTLDASNLLRPTLLLTSMLWIWAPILRFLQQVPQPHPQTHLLLVSGHLGGSSTVWGDGNKRTPLLYNPMIIQPISLIGCLIQHFVCVLFVCLFKHLTGWQCSSAGTESAYTHTHTRPWFQSSAPQKRKASEALEEKAEGFKLFLYVFKE